MNTLVINIEPSSIEQLMEALNSVVEREQEKYEQRVQEHNGDTHRNKLELTDSGLTGGETYTRPNYAL